MSLVSTDPQIPEKMQLALINIGSACKQPYYVQGVCQATYMRQRAERNTVVEQCPLSSEGSTCGKRVYSKGVCRRCSRSDLRRLSDIAYDSSSKGMARRQDYEFSEKGREKKRRYARKVAIAKRVSMYLRADVPIDKNHLLENIQSRYAVSEMEAVEILADAMSYAKSHPGI